MSQPTSCSSDFDRQIMQRCIQLAKKAAGKTAPNPLVGSVIVKDDKIIGEGFHPQAGQPHAEIFALKDAGIAAKGATLYVNLEPCNHYGRTPPCSEALITAGVAKVVVGMVDCDPRVAGGGDQEVTGCGNRSICWHRRSCLSSTQRSFYSSDYPSKTLWYP